MPCFVHLVVLEAAVSTSVASICTSIRVTLLGTSPAHLADVRNISEFLAYLGIFMAHGGGCSWKSSLGYPYMTRPCSGYSSQLVADAASDRDAENQNQANGKAWKIRQKHHLWLKTMDSVRRFSHEPTQ